MEAFAHAIPLIRPITDLRTKLNDVCEQATMAQEPVILTKNGVPAYVLMDASKIDAPGLLWFGTLEGVEAIVVDADPHDLVAADAEEAGCELIVAPADH